MAVEQSFSNLKVFTDHSGPHYMQSLIQWVWAVPRSHIHNGLPGDADAADPRLRTEEPGWTIDSGTHASRGDLSIVCTCYIKNHYELCCCLPL